MNISAIVDLQWGIGREGQLLAYIPPDLRRFRTLTRGKTVIMGRHTFASLPGGRALVERRNIVLTRNPALTLEGAECAYTLEHLFSLIADTPPEDVFVAGGAEVYNTLLPYCERAYITKIDLEFPNADRFCPNLDATPGWELEEPGEREAYGEYVFRYCVYRFNRQPLSISPNTAADRVKVQPPEGE